MNFRFFSLFKGLLFYIFGSFLAPISSWLSSVGDVILWLLRLWDPFFPSPSLFFPIFWVPLDFLSVNFFINTCDLNVESFFLDSPSFYNRRFFFFFFFLFFSSSPNQKKNCPPFIFARYELCVVFHYWALLWFIAQTSSKAMKGLWALFFLFCCFLFCFVVYIFFFLSFSLYFFCFFFGPIIIHWMSDFKCRVVIVKEEKENEGKKKERGDDKSVFHNNHWAPLWIVKPEKNSYTKTTTK